MSNKDYNFTFHIALAGDAFVGKTCLSWRLSDQSFNEEYVSTIGVELQVKTFKVGD